MYHVDYNSLAWEEKREFVHQFGQRALKSLDQEPINTSWIAQLLIINRCWNSFRLMEDGQPEPAVIPVALDLLWKKLDKRADNEEFSLFEQRFSASMLEVMNGDDSELMNSEQNKEFHQRYFSEWNHFYTILLASLGSLLWQIQTLTVNWNEVHDLLYGDIGEDKIEAFEPVYNSGKGGYTIAEIETREKQVYQTPTFCRVVALFQQDIRESLVHPNLEELRRKYRNELLFVH